MEALKSAVLSLYHEVIQTPTAAQKASSWSGVTPEFRSNIRNILEASVVVSAFFAVLLVSFLLKWFPLVFFVSTIIITPPGLLLFTLMNQGTLKLPKAPSTFLAIKLGHFASGVLTVVFLLLLGKPVIQSLYLSFAAASATYLYLRRVLKLDVNIINNMFVGLFGGESFGGRLILGPYLGMLGIIPVLLFFGDTTAYLAILSFAVLDPIAAIVGRYWGYSTWFFNPDKTVEGSAAGFLAASALLIPLVGVVPSTVTALSMSFMEALRLPLGDNLYLPSAAALILSHLG